MKIKNIFMLLGLAGLFAACNEDPEFYKLDKQPDEMHVKASTDELICDQGKAQETAITFTWDAQTSPYGKDDKVKYGIRFYASSNKERYITSVYDVEEGKREFSLTNEQLNNIVGRWTAAGDRILVTAQLLANVQNENHYVLPAISTVEFAVTGYERFPENIFFVMKDAATGEVTKQTLTQKERGTGVYQATFDIYPCTYHIETTANDYPVYGADLTDDKGEKMVYVTTGDYTEFTCDEIGSRTVIVDTNEEYYDCRLLDIIQLPNDKMWIVGMGTSVGWNTDTPEGKMTMIGGARDPYIWSWTGQFYNVEDAKAIKDDSPGEFKIGLGSGWSDPFLFAPYANADPATEHGFSGPRLQNDGGDNKWVVKTSGIYTLTVYLLADDPHTTFEPVTE